MTLKRLSMRIKLMEKYIPKHCSRSNDDWPQPGRYYWPRRWIMEYYFLLKDEYYRRLAKRKVKLKIK
jgi:hypothetical protein